MDAAEGEVEYFFWVVSRALAAYFDDLDGCAALTDDLVLTLEAQAAERRVAVTGEGVVPPRAAFREDVRVALNLVEEDAAGGEDAADFGDGSLGGGDEVQDMYDEDGRESGVAEGQAGCVAEDEVWLAVLSSELSDKLRHHVARDVDAGDGDTAGHEGTRDAARADADLKEAVRAGAPELGEDGLGDGASGFGRHSTCAVVEGGCAVEGDGVVGHEG